VLDGTSLEGELKAEQNISGTRTHSFRTVCPDADPALLPLLHAKKVEIRVASDDTQLGRTLLVYLLPWVLIVLVWSWISRRTRAMMPGGNPLGMLKSKSHRFEKSTAAPVTFNDIAGLESTKRDLREVVQFLKDPERFQRLGGRVHAACCSWVRPVRAKTLLARAVAGESGVPFFGMSASEFIEMFVGVGAARVRDLFEEAKKNSNSSPGCACCWAAMRRSSSCWAPRRAARKTISRRRPSSLRR
jgi:cell division protease FtsH